MANQNVVFIDNRPNQIPDEIKAKIVPLQPGQVVRIKLNPLKFKKVKMISGTTDSMEVPKQTGMVSRAGNIGLAARWEIIHDNKRIPCGFYSETDGQGNPAYKPLKFNFGADLFLYGDNEQHKSIYELLQIHPQYKNRVNGAPSKMWVCELDIAEAASSSEVDKFFAKNKVETRMANLNQDELNILMSAARYGVGFLNRPDALGNSTIARGILVSESLKAGGIARIEKLLKDMDRAKEILFIQDCLTNQKLVLVGKDLLDEKGAKIHLFTEPSKAANHEEAAIWLHEKGGKIPAVIDALEAIRTYKKK